MGSSPSLLGSSYYTGVSCYPGNMDRPGLGPDPQHPNVTKQRLHQNQAVEQLNRALSVDESSSSLQGKAAALQHYRAGIEQLEQGVALYLPKDPNDPGLVRAHTLRGKMIGNLETARERLTFLSTSLHLETLSLKEEAPRQGRQREKSPGPKPCRPTSLDTTFTVTPKAPSTASANVRALLASSPLGPNPRNNRAAELRKKSVVKARSPGGKEVRSPVSGRKRSEAEGLKEAAKLIKGCDPKLVEAIMQEVVAKGATGVKFGDISGQEKAKGALQEMVVLPTLRPDLFTGLRAPARGLLLFGPPGNGKTLLARALAAEASSNLINISSSSLTSKWLGEGEKLVKALFAVARHLQPSIIFIDEIDALLSERKSGEHEGVRRIKTEFLLQFEGMLTGKEERVVVVAATNRPQELDDAALRRFTKRVYVEMPDEGARRDLVCHLLAQHGDHKLSGKDLDKIVSLTSGYSCSDLTNLARDAALAPVRELNTAQLATVKPQDVRKLAIQDFIRSSERVRKSLSQDSLQAYERWNKAFGDIS